MAKLQKRFAYKYRGKEGEKVHYKHQLTIPDKIVSELGWKEGEEIDYEVKDSLLVVHQAKRRGR